MTQLAHAVVLVRRLLRVQVMNELQYRANFVMQIFQAALSLGVSLTIVVVVFEQVDQLNGWSRPELIILVGVFTLVGGLLRMIVRPNMNLLVMDVYRGTLDYVLTKPVDSQLLLSIREIRIWQLVDVLAGAGTIGWGVVATGGRVGLVDSLMFAAALVLGMVILYCFLFSLICTAFWFVRVKEIAELFESVTQAARWPLSIYPSWIRFGLTFVVPVAFAITLPAQALLSRLSWLALLGELVLTCGFLAFTRWFFRMALRRYTGASA
ncbi:ABC transporter permease [Kibdelosporangium aridum]|uniref:ABC transporter permease n=1 Tax=Kibdelosporangium aridum TaxID=2030 RepID=UPI0006894044